MCSRIWTQQPRWLRAPEGLVAAALIAAAIAASWAGSLDASFQFDDWNVIVHDPRVQSVAAWWHALPAIRPLLKLAYALVHELGAGPRGFRLFNLGVHFFNAVLVFALIRRRAPHFAAIACALLFALEPVQSEAVTYVSGGSSALAALPCLAALWCWDRAAADCVRLDRMAGVAARRSPIGPRALHGLGLACYVAALAVKETSAVLPLALWLWQATAGRARPDGDVGARAANVPGPSPWKPLQWPRRERRALLGYAAIAALAFAIALASPTYHRLLVVSLGARPTLQNLALQAHAWGFLAGQLVSLSALNADPTPQALATTAGDACAWAAPWIAAIAVAWALRRRAPALAFGVGWFVIWLLPTNSLLPRLDPANDRQLYLALVGPASLVGLALARLHRPHALYAWLLLGLLAATLGVSTAQRNRVYHTEITFWQDTLQRSPSDARAANNLGIAYALACRDSDAQRAFARAVALNPAGYRARINRALLAEHALTRPEAGGCRLAVP